ncbi:MAG: hypothetical protein ACJASP_002554 [Roseivirga sp.]|jgi:hypothetical protein
MKKFVIIALGVLLIGGAASYIYFGGLNSVDISVANVEGYTIGGRLYQGKSKSKVIEDYFFEAKELTQSKTLDGILTIVHYNDTTLAKGETKLFIGVTFSSEDFTLPDDYQLLTIAATKSVRARVEAHNVVVPTASTIEKRMAELARKEGLKTQGFTIEKYVSTTILEIDYPLVKKN